MIINFKVFVVVILALLGFSSCDGDPVYAYDDVAIDGNAYRGLSRSVQNKLFDEVERYDLEALYSVIFDDRDYLVLEWHESATVPDRPVKGYSFVLFDEKVSFSVDSDHPELNKNNYIIGLGDASFVKDEDIVDRSINFVVEDGVIRYSHTTSNFVEPASFEGAGVVWGVVSSDHQEAYLSIWGASTTINYASYSTDFDGNFANRHWLKIKDYSIRVGRLSDYEKIIIIGVVAVGFIFIRFFKFRS